MIAEQLRLGHTWPPGIWIAPIRRYRHTVPAESRGSIRPELMLDLTLVAVVAGLVWTGVMIVQMAAIMRSIPFVRTTPETVTRMVALCEIRDGHKAADLGSGDGRVVIALARAGAEAHGYEINPFLVLWSRFRVRRAGLSDRATIHWKSFWKHDFSSFRVVTVFGTLRVMERLEQKLRAELKPGARVVSNLFQLPTWPHLSKENSVYLYEKARDSQARLVPPRSPRQGTTRPGCTRSNADGTLFAPA